MDRANVPKPSLVKRGDGELARNLLARISAIMKEKRERHRGISAPRERQYPASTLHPRLGRQFRWAGEPKNLPRLSARRFSWRSDWKKRLLRFRRVDKAGKRAEIRGRLRDQFTRVEIREFPQPTLLVTKAP